MLKTPTVFVLGAGASNIFGFPLGLELCQQVKGAFAPGQSQFQALLEMTAFRARDVELFRNELLFSGQSSVDAFLELRPEFTDVGKAAMAYLLIGAENESILWERGPHDHWINYLLGYMSCSFEDFGKNSVSFLTFNYDRSLEHYLHRALMSRYGKTSEECKVALDQIPIIHLHGRLGYLPWQQKYGRSYQPVVDAKTLEMCVSGIKIVHEETTDRDDDFKQARKLLTDAGRIYFLGFGFGSKNIERLEITNLESGKAWATGVGIEGRELSTTTHACGSKVAIQQAKNCMWLLKHVAQFD